MRAHIILAALLFLCVMTAQCNVYYDELPDEDLDVGSGGSFNLAPDKPEYKIPIREDLPYLKCPVCKRMVDQMLAAEVGLRQQWWEEKGRVPYAYELLDEFESLCQLEEEMGQWLDRVDVRARGSSLLVDVSNRMGICKRECNTVKKVCTDLSGDVTPLVADHMGLEDKDSRPVQSKITGVTKPPTDKWKNQRKVGKLASKPQSRVRKMEFYKLACDSYCPGKKVSKKLRKQRKKWDEKLEYISKREADIRRKLAGRGGDIQQSIMEADTQHNAALSDEAVRQQKRRQQRLQKQRKLKEHAANLRAKQESQRKSEL